MKRNHLMAALSALLALAGVSGSLSAQSVQPRSASASELAKYDRNKNGRLDADELATMQADEARIRLSATVMNGVRVMEPPFQQGRGRDSLARGRLSRVLASRGL